MGADAECFPTVSTLKGPLSCVGPLVLDQGRAPAEVLPTLQTLIRLLSSVDPLMLHQRRTLAKSFPAVGAFKGFLGRHWQGGRRWRRLQDHPLPVTFGAFGGVPAPGWRFLEVVEGGRTEVVAFATICTLVWLLPRVDSLVPVKVGTAAETLPTVVALIRPLSRVDPLVSL